MKRAPRLEIHASARGGGGWFRVVVANGRVLAHSETYSRLRDLMRATRQFVRAVYDGRLEVREAPRRARGRKRGR